MGSGGTSDPRNETMLKIFSFVNAGERTGSGLGTIEGGWTAVGYPAPTYDVAYGPDRTTLTLPLVSAVEEPSKTVEGKRSHAYRDGACHHRLPEVGEAIAHI